MLYFKLLSIALFLHLLSQFLLISKLKVSFCFLFLFFIYLFIYFILGIILILAGQCVSATQMTVEEVFLKKKKFHPLQVSITCIIMALWCYVMSFCDAGDGIQSLPVGKNIGVWMKILLSLMWRGTHAVASIGRIIYR